MYIFKICTVHNCTYNGSWGICKNVSLIFFRSVFTYVVDTINPIGVLRFQSGIKILRDFYNPHNLNSTFLGTGWIRSVISMDRTRLRSSWRTSTAWKWPPSTASWCLTTSLRPETSWGRRRPRWTSCEMMRPSSQAASHSCQMTTSKTLTSMDLTWVSFSSVTDKSVCQSCQLFLSKWCLRVVFHFENCFTNNWWKLVTLDLFQNSF